MNFTVATSKAGPNRFLLAGGAVSRSIGKNRLLVSSLGLAMAGTFFLLPISQAQVVNDPAEAMVNRTSAFQSVYIREAPPEEAQKQPGQQPAAVESVQSQKSEVKPAPAELQPALDVDSQAAQDVDPADPIKARAVMVDINSNTLNYDKDHDVYVATGSVHMVISEQNSELYADKLTYDQNQNLAIAEGSVVIIKDGQRTEGKYAKIDLTRRSALINDPATTISAVRVKAKQSFVNNSEIIMEEGRLIISGVAYQELVKQGGLQNLAQGSAGKGAQQAKLKREYTKKVYQNRDAMFNQLSYEQQLNFKSVEQAGQGQKDPFDDSPESVSRFSIKAKEIEIVRHEDGYDEINLKHPSLYAGKYKLFNMPDADFSYDGVNKNVQYLGPDVGSYRAYGGMYAGPGWDFHVGRGSLRISPIVSYGSPGFWSSNGKDGKQISNGLGFGGIAHFRDPDTAIDLAYNSRVGSPVLYADRRIFGESTHLMASYNDVYQNGLMGQTEHPTYIAQLTDYRVLKDFNKFQLTSFESIGYAKDNFYPNFQENYFVESKGKSPQILGRAQLQFQLANTSPLLRIGKFASVGMRAQLLTAAYTSSDFIALGRIGPTLSMNLMGGRLQTSMGYTLSHSIGKSPFVFDSYYGGAQNVNMNNLVRVNKFLSIGNSGSFSLKRDNAKKALAVGNLLYMMVGPEDLKATIGYDFINSRSYFGFNYYPGTKNSVVNFDKMKIIQPSNYTQPGVGSNF
jgi:hypothetical protein